jgi:hypothetical protein
MEASNGAIAISVKPAAVRIRATRPWSPNENGPGASGTGGAVGGTMPLHGVEPGLVSDPALPALAIPVGDLIGILLCNAISFF